MGTIYTSPNDENIISGKSEIWVDGVNLGYTTGGWTLRKSNEWLDIEADQSGGKMKKIRYSESLFLTGTLLEATAKNLRLAMNEPAANEVASGSMLIIGSSELTVEEHTILLKGVAPGTGQKRWFEFFRAVVADDLDHPFGQRNAVSSVPIGFELLKDDTRDFAFGTFWDEVAGTTPNPS